MLVLGFDTATPAVSAALHDGTRIVGSALTVDARRQGELLSPMIAKVMADAGVDRTDLTAVAVGVGPGPYTGLRVGLVTAKVLGSVLGIPVHGVCTLDIIAAQAAPDREFLVATDARRKEVYWARYDGTGRRIVGPEVSKPAEIPVAGLSAAGEGPMLYPELLPRGLGPAYPAAATLCRIAVAALAAGDPATVLLPPEPLYLRRPDAREPGAPKRVTP